MEKNKRALLLWFIHYALLLAIIVSSLLIIIPRLSSYTSPYYSQNYFKSLESAYNSSQYRQKENPGIIPDETVFSYAAGAYLRGLDPIMVNSEITPLGKYFLAASIYAFHNDRTIILLFALLAGVSIWLVSKTVLKDSTVALIPILLISLDALFRNQLVIVPLMDIIQLPFIYFTLAAFLYERKVKRFVLTAFSIGFVMATKSVVPGMLLVICVGLFLLLRKEHKQLMHFASWLPLAAALFILTYVRTFMSGYTFWDFLKFQKWIFLYQKSKLIYPFSSLRLLMLNQWQSWWGDFSILRANDWSMLWPISFLASLAVGVWLMRRKRWQVASNQPAVLLLMWVIIYQAFLSLGVVSSRFFIPVLPAQYILLVYAVSLLPWKKIHPKILLFGLLFLFLRFPVSVSAAYVLPYPSYMPGNKLYRVSRLIDQLKAPLYFGDIGGFKYHLGLSDTYLVEAKTLFEYKQYLLAAEALRRTDKEFASVTRNLISAKQHSKDVTALQRIYYDAAITHIAVLTRLLGEVPVSFTWTPEKAEATQLDLHDMLRHGIDVRIAAASASASL